jgi:periplasmic protein TonB
MSTIVKETEVSSTAPDPLSGRPASSGAAANEAASKPQPVALEVSVTVNGARTVDGSEKREPFSESTKTVLVFGNGAVIRLQSSVAPGQLLFLTNEKTKKEVVCQVVKSKNYRNVSGYVELEFTEPVIGFWGMRFPGDRISAVPATAAVAPAAPAVAVPSVSATNSAPSKISASAPETKIPAPPTQEVATETPVASIAGTATTATSTTATSTVPPAKVTPISPFVSKSSGSTNSSASSSVLPSSSVLTLPRAAQQKPAAPTAIHITPPATPVAPAPPARAAEKPSTAISAADSSTEALKAENARLQEQLSAFLFPNAKKAEANKTELKGEEAGKGSASVSSASVTSAPPAEAKATETAAKILDLAQLAGVLPAPTKPINAAPTVPTAPTVPVAKVPPPPASANPAAPPATLSKISALPLPSLLETEQVKIPSWLEPLARNAAVHAPVEAPDQAVVAQSLAGTNAVFEEPVPDVHWLHKDELHKGGAGKDDSHLEPGQYEISDKDASQQDDAQESAIDVPAPDFGSSFLLGEKNQDEVGAQSSRKGVIAGIAATILLAAGGGYWYTHQSESVPAASARVAQNTPASLPPSATAGISSGSSDVQRTAANSSVANSSATSSLTSPRPGGAIINQAATPAPLNTNMVTPGRAGQPTAGAPLPAVATSLQPAASQPPAVGQPPAAQPKRPSLGAVHLAAPTVAHSGSSASAAEADPSIGLNGDAVPDEANLGANFPSISGPVAPSNPIPVGGNVKSAQLLKSVPPVYPSFAKTQRISGDVKIDALIDATGKVTTMKVVSGPTLLHQAAMDALHQWKYQPASLDGKAVPMHLTVTIQFHMQ